MTPQQISSTITALPNGGYLHHCGTEFVKWGYGKYPYPCLTADKYPQAMVYHRPKCACWFHDETDQDDTGDRP